jgi:hypothetical protein
MLKNRNEKKEKTNLQPEEYSKKNNLKIDCPSFFPKDIKKKMKIQMIIIMMKISKYL